MGAPTKSGDHQAWECHGFCDEHMYSVSNGDRADYEFLPSGVLLYVLRRFDQQAYLFWSMEADGSEEQ